MKNLNNLIDYVQSEMQDERQILFNCTKSELFYFLTAMFMIGEVGLYLITH
jgi:hypothetical protein